MPLLIADCDVPAILAQHATLDARTPRQREAAAAWLRERLGQLEPLDAPIACPYPGMRPFSATMVARFHGCEREIESVVSGLNAGEREVYVIGPSDDPTRMVSIRRALAASIPPNLPPPREAHRSGRRTEDQFDSASQI